MKIATYNINWIDSRLDNLLRRLKVADPDIVCLQKLKSESHKFPAAKLKAAGDMSFAYNQLIWIRSSEKR